MEMQNQNLPPELGDTSAAAIDSLWAAKRENRKKSRRGKAVEGMSLQITSVMDMFTIIMIFLLKNYATDPVNIQQSDVLQLPSSVSKIPLERTVVITITTQAIIVDDAKVVDLRQGSVDPSNKRDGATGFFIEPLYQSLQNAMQKAKAMRQRNPQAVTSLGMAMILGDQRINYRLLSEILYTAGQAEFNQFKFGVVRISGKGGAGKAKGKGG
jgi:Biopolymer transport protein ExbD/TolR